MIPGEVFFFVGLFFHIVFSHRPDNKLGLVQFQPICLFADRIAWLINVFLKCKTEAESNNLNRLFGGWYLKLENKDDRACEYEIVADDIEGA